MYNLTIIIIFITFLFIGIKIYKCYFKQNNQTFGILFSKTSNLGDDIQTIAQMQYIPKNAKTIIVEREHLDKETRKCIVIMNGWWMHDDRNFPPHKSINPIYISFHIEQNKKGMLSNKSIDHFKKHGHIGCRDLNTMKLLQNKGVDSYLSRCLTLTLKNPFSNPKRTKIYIVDAHLPSKNLYPYGADHLLEKLIPKSIREQAIYIEHEIPTFINKNDIYQRQKYVQENLLNKYAEAKLVITSRLHCTLPCVAYNTPCILLFDRLHTDQRYEGLTNLFHGYDSIESIIDFDFSNPSPKLTIMELNTLQEQLRNDIRTRIKHKLNTFNW